MGLLFKGLQAVKVPDFASVNEATSDVIVSKEQHNACQIIIGQYLGNGLMLANSNFKKHHENLFSNRLGDSIPLNNVVSAGIYTAALKLISNDSFYQNLQASFNDDLSNALLDYSLYSLIAEKHPSLSYQQYTRSYVPFSTSTKDIAWFNDADNNISDSDLNEFSFSRLAQASTYNPSSEYYLVLKLSNLDTTSDPLSDNANQTSSSQDDSEDLSSLDSLVEDNSSVADPVITVSVVPDETAAPASQDDSLEAYRIVERHFALTASFIEICENPRNSFTEAPKASSIYINDNASSKIIAQFVFTGTSSAIGENLDKALLSFKSHNREINTAFICGDEASAILYSWANHNNIQWLHLHDPFDEQHADMQAQYSYILRNDTSAYIPFTGLSGVTAQHKNDEIRDTKNFIFLDRHTAETDATALLNNVYKEQRRIRQLITDGKTDVCIDKRYAKFINLNMNAERQVTVSIDNKRLSDRLNMLGYISITCMPSNELTNVCRTYLMLKHSLDKACIGPVIDSTGYSSEASLELQRATQELCAYIKSELKFDLTKLAYQRGLSYTQLIDELEDILFVDLSESHDYQVLKHKGFNNHMLILKHIGVDLHGLQSVAEELTSIALQRKISANRSIPEPLPEKEQSVAAFSNSTDAVHAPVKRGRGRPKGSKNKATLADEKAMSTAATQSTEKRGRGRPKGSKNKTTIANEVAMTTAATQSTEKRGRGRPKGSKNKATLANEAMTMTTASTQSTEKRGRGRPKGSKNKATLANEAMAMTTASTQSTEKRGRGRPKGSKNKATLTAEKGMSTAATQSTEKRGRGRPKGSKNKATLANEAMAMTTAATQSTEKRGRGRPKGSKNKATLAAEQVKTTAATQSTEKRGRGRPKGSKNKSTLAAEKAMTTAATQSTEKRGRGRPKGSKNKATLAAEQTLSTTATQSSEKRGRGRPKGSKNKATLAAEQALSTTATQSSEKRGRGRPKGSKNKATLANEDAMTNTASQSSEKRGRGRPKGSKNKATLANEATMKNAASQSTEKRGRGRPKGSKNKPK